MKQLSRIASAAALAAGLFGSAQVMAVEVCSNCKYRTTDATYLGVHDATTADSSGFRRDGFSVGAVTFITDTWVFDLQPVGAVADVNASFRPVGLAFTMFEINIYSVTATCPNGISTSTVDLSPTAPGACTNGSIVLTSASLATSSFSSLTSSAAINAVGLSAGRYAFQVSGFAQVLTAPATANYSGQIGFTPIPEPGSLALVGLALVGAAVGARRSRKA